MRPVRAALARPLPAARPAGMRTPVGLVETPEALAVARPAGRAAAAAAAGAAQPAVERVARMSSPSLRQPAGGARRVAWQAAAGGLACDDRAHDDLACDDRPLRLMAVHAHPDDESSKGAATMARYVREGVDVLVCTLTGGERGDILNKAMDRPEIRADLPGIRRAEMAAARDILGVRQRFLGFVDSGLPEGDPLPPLPDGCFALQPLEAAARPLVAAVREFRPHVILTYDENGGYPHPDHIMTHRVSVEAFEAAADPDRYQDCGEPWQPLKLYYFVTFHRARFAALHEKMLEHGLESPYAERLTDDQDAPPRRSWEITTSVPCADYFAIRDQALLAHATQVDPNGGWFACPVQIQRAAWPTEDYHLARSVVDTGKPEDDLFAGIRERVRL